MRAFWIILYHTNCHNEGNEDFKVRGLLPSTVKSFIKSGLENKLPRVSTQSLCPLPKQSQLPGLRKGEEKY